MPCGPVLRAARDRSPRASGRRPRPFRAAGESPFQRAGRASRSPLPGRRERQVLLFGKHRRGALEQADIVPLDRAQMPEQRHGKLVAAPVAEKARETSSASRSAGSVWVCSSAVICRRCSTRRRKSYAAVSSSRAVVSIQPSSASVASVGTVSRPRRLGVASAGDELLGLNEKFDLADAAAAELDVVPLDRDFAVTAVGVDLPASWRGRRRPRRNRDICAR